MATNENLYDKNVTELGNMIRNKHVSPVEVTQSFLDRITEVEPVVNSFITLMSEEALKEAKEAETEVIQNRYRGPLHGIPIGIKDLFNTKGVRTTSGSTIYQNFIPSENSGVVQRLKVHGGIILGKLMMTEFAFGNQGKNFHYGEVKNPWGNNHITGGSSSGSGASVAARECPISLGSDTGGSVRVPASLCGVVGMKPTYGLITRYGMTPLSSSLDHVGPLGSTVEGVAIALQALAGYDPKDSTSVNFSPPNYIESLDGNIHGLRIGIPKEYVFDILDPEIKQGFNNAVRQLESMGASVETVSIPRLEQLGPVMSTIIPADAASVHRDTVLNRGDEYDPTTRLHIESGFFIQAADYMRAQRLRREVNLEIEDVLSRVDVIVTPTTPVPAQPYGQDEVTVGSTKQQVRFLLSRITRMFNSGGFPAISVPCGFTKDKLPIGLHIVSQLFKDEMTLRVAHAYEQSTSWNLERPSL
jgi:aspartyl-tRNA(Asn)/glutamyl-tRNA(Gln) amidotransferase subunit A